MHKGNVLALIAIGLVIAALLAVTAIMSKRALPTKKLDKAEVQNEIYNGCKPLSICLTTGLFDPATSELIGFSFWYKLPGNKRIKNVNIQILNKKGDVIYQGFVDLRPGTNELWFTEEDFPGASQTCKIILEIEGTKVSLPANPRLDDEPSFTL